MSKSWVGFQAGGGVLVDEFDELAHQYAAYDLAGDVVGSVRVVPDGPLGLPLERCFPLGDYRDGKRLVEFCRLAVARKYRASRLSFRLMRAAYQRASATGATHVAIDAYLGGEQIALFEKLGFERLGMPFLDGEYLCPLPVVVLAQPISALFERWPAERPSLHRFFTQTDPDITHD